MEGKSSRKSSKKKRKRDVDYEEDGDFDPTAVYTSAEEPDYDYSSDRGYSNGSYYRKQTHEKTRKKTKRRRRKKFDSNYEDDSDDQFDIGNKPQHQFWKMVEEFFQPVHSDPEKLKLLEPVDIDTDPDIIEIPLLGPHYLQKWTDQREPNQFTSTDNNFVDVEVACDYFDSSTMSQRLLQAIVEEREVPLSRRNKKGRPNKHSKSNYDTRTVMQAGLNATTEDYSSKIVNDMEDRIIQELQGLGLMSEETIQKNGKIPDVKKEKDFDQQEDEVLLEIKSLQRKLAEHIKLTNEMRISIRKNVEDRKAEEEAMVNQRRMDQQTIADYEYRFQFHPKKKH